MLYKLQWNGWGTAIVQHSLLHSLINWHILICIYTILSTQLCFKHILFTDTCVNTYTGKRMRRGKDATMPSPYIEYKVINMHAHIHTKLSVLLHLYKLQIAKFANEWVKFYTIIFTVFLFLLNFVSTRNESQYKREYI